MIHNRAQGNTLCFKFIYMNFFNLLYGSIEISSLDYFFNEE